MQACKGKAAPSRIRVSCVCKWLHKEHSYPILRFPCPNRNRGEAQKVCTFSMSCPAWTLCDKKWIFLFCSTAKDPGGCWMWWQSLLSAQGLATFQDQQHTPREASLTKSWSPSAKKTPAAMEAASQAVPTKGIILQQICSCSLGAVLYCA